MYIGKTAALAALGLGMMLGGAVNANAEEGEKSSFDKFYGGITVSSDNTTFESNGGSAADKSLSFGVVAGKNFVIQNKLFLGAEAALHFTDNRVSGPTTPPLPVMFTTAEAKKAMSFSFNAKAGFLFNKVAVYGLVGVTNSRFKFLVDDTPVGTFFGTGSSTASAWGLTVGAGIEIAIPKTPVHIRGEWRRTRYVGISAEDFGLTDANFGVMDLNLSHTSTEFRGAVIVPF